MFLTKNSSFLSECTRSCVGTRVDTGASRRPEERPGTVCMCDGQLNGQGQRVMVKVRELSESHAYKKIRRGVTQARTIRKVMVANTNFLINIIIHHRRVLDDNTDQNTNEKKFFMRRKLSDLFA